MIRFVFLVGTHGILVSTCGCASIVLSAEDAIVATSGRTELVAHLERAYPFGLREGMERVPIEFLVESSSVTHCHTSHRGQAKVLWRSGSTLPHHFEARARLCGSVLQAEGSVFEWQATKTIIAVDIDETICATNYSSMLLKKRDRISEPLPRAVETLNAISKDYHILYITARPRFLLDTTRLWLKHRGFPGGPVIVAPGLPEWWNQAQFKRETFARLRHDWPGLLIGIGDRAVDVDSCQANRMLSIIVNRGTGYNCGNKGVDLPDWAAVSQFFQQHHELLANPARLASMIDRDSRLISKVHPNALAIRERSNSKLMQDSNTSDQILPSVEDGQLPLAPSHTATRQRDPGQRARRGQDGCVSGY